MMNEWESFEAIIRDCQQGLFVFLLARCAGREQALDALQNVFMRAWVARTKILPMDRTDQRRYLWTMARHRAIDLTRQRQSQRKIARSLADDEDPPAPQSNTDDRLIHLQRAIDTLAPEDRELIYLSTIEKWDSNELSKRLGMQPGSVRARLSRIRRELRAKITAAVEEETHGK